MPKKADAAPLREENRRRTSRIPGPPGPRSIRPCRLRVLVIDDEPMVLRSIERMLGHHDVTTVCGGDKALGALERETFDVILCDVNMPHVGGVGIYEYLSRLFPGAQTRIVFMTGGVLREGALAFLEGTANLLIRKPFTREQLESALAAAAVEATAPASSENVATRR